MKIEDEEIIKLQGFIEDRIYSEEQELARRCSGWTKEQLLLSFGTINGLRIAATAIKAASTNIVLDRKGDRK